MDDLEKELARSRRILDEASRVVSSKRDEIDLLRKQAMVLNEEFLRRSNDLDRAKVNLAICLEQANQIVKAKQFVQEQSDDLRADATKERQAWMDEREAVIARIKRLLEGLDEDKPAIGGDGDPAWGNLTAEQETYALERVKQLAATIERALRRRAAGCCCCCCCWGGEAGVGGEGGGVDEPTSPSPSTITGSAPRSHLQASSERRLRSRRTSTYGSPPSCACRRARGRRMQVGRCCSYHRACHTHSLPPPPPLLLPQTASWRASSRRRR